MSIFSAKYFLKKFFPSAWFGGGGEIAGPQFADMSCMMTGSGSMTGTLVAAGAQQPVSGGGVILRKRPFRIIPFPRRGRIIDISAVMQGGGTLFSWSLSASARMGLLAAGEGKMTGALSATGSIGCQAQGQGTMVAMPILDISALIRRCREEELIMTMLMEAI